MITKALEAVKQQTAKLFSAWAEALTPKRLEQYSDAQLADEIGDLKVLRKAANELEELLVTVCKLRGLSEIEGDKWRVTVGEVQREFIPIEVLKEKVGPKWWMENVQITAYYRLEAYGRKLPVHLLLR